jgi:hypothetical protein
MKKKLFTILMCSGIFISMAQLPDYLPINGLKAFYPFNGNANDESGNVVNGVVNGAVLTTDRFGLSNSSYEFDGINDFINVPDNSNNDLDTNYTVSVWYLPYNGFGSGSAPNGSFNQIISKWGIGGVNNAQFMFGVNQQGFINASNYNSNFTTAVLTSTQPISTNSWHHLVITFKNHKIKLYKNGDLIDSISNIPYPQASNYSLNIGKEGGGNYGFQKGKIDDIGIWNRALDHTEITHLFESCNVVVNIATNITTTLAQSTNIIVNSNASSPTYQWFEFDGNNSTSLSDGCTYSGTQTANLTIPVSTSNLHNKMYRCLVTDGVCSDTSNFTTLNIDSLSVTIFDTISTNINIYDTITTNVTIYDTVFVYDNICSQYGNDSTWLVNNGYITGPNSGGGTCQGLNIHTETKWINTKGTDSLYLATFQHRLYDYSKIYDKNNVLIWQWDGENASATWYSRSHKLKIEGNDSVRIEFHQGYQDNFCNGFLQVTKMICSQNYYNDTITTNVYDTTFVTIQDTIFTNINVYDTTFVTIHDTITTNINVYDTITTNINVYDTITTNVTVYDTITTNVNVFDTTFVTVNDTVYTYISVTDTLIIQASLGLAPPNDVNIIKVYPNPASTHIYIHTGDFGLMTGYKIRIDNSLGQVVYETLIEQQEYFINLSTWSGNGTYLIYILDDQNNINEVKKIILQ